MKVEWYHVCLPGKEEKHYRYLIDTLKIETIERVEGRRLQPRFVLTDFENAAINAFKYAFPGIKCKGCHFHYCQALWRKMVELGMKKSYEEDYELRDWLRLFMALPLVPVELVKNAYDEILNYKPVL